MIYSLNSKEQQQEKKVMTKINSKTTLKAIQAQIAHDFGVVITKPEAREIKACIREGLAVWTNERYTSTITGGFNQITPNGVRYCTAWYGRKEWNSLQRVQKIDQSVHDIARLFDHNPC